VGGEGAGLDAGGAGPLALVDGHVGFAGPDKHRTLIVLVCKRLPGASVFLMQKAIIFILKTRYAMSCVVHFYNALWYFGIFCGILVYFVFWCIFPRLGILYKETFGNSAEK
jgi:hypothetical protein